MTLSELNDELTRIAGRNSNGQPYLRAVDGRSETTWLAGGQRLKYLDRMEDGVEIGQECAVIEIWRSPEFLAASGRFRDRFDTDGSELLPALSSNGHYDYMLRLSFPDLANRAGETLATIRDVWAMQRLSIREQNALIDQHEGRMKAQRAKLSRERRNDLWGFNPDDWRLVRSSTGHLKYERIARQH